MVRRRGHRHQFTIDGQAVWLDSLNESIALTRIIDTYGFTGRWLRPRYGVKHAHCMYTPDFELSVRYGNNSVRALVEIKEYKRDLTKSTIRRISVTSRHYLTDRLYLYAVKTDRWYEICKRSGGLTLCPAPHPGALPVERLFVPLRFVTRSYHGRKYYRSFGDVAGSILKRKKTR